jgi:hypothetical protein
MSCQDLEQLLVLSIELLSEVTFFVVVFLEGIVEDFDVHLLDIHLLYLVILLGL